MAQQQECPSSLPSNRMHLRGCNGSAQGQDIHRWQRSLLPYVSSTGRLCCYVVRRGTALQLCCGIRMAVQAQGRVKGLTAVCSAQGAVGRQRRRLLQGLAVRPERWLLFCWRSFRRRASLIRRPSRILVRFHGRLETHAARSGPPFSACLMQTHAHARFGRERGTLPQVPGMRAPHAVQAL